MECFRDLETKKEIFQRKIEEIYHSLVVFRDLEKKSEGK